jgi:hypothetical protein
MAVDEETARWLFYEIAEQHCQSCGKQLTWANRGREGRGAWEIHHIGRRMHSHGTNSQRGD